MLTIKAGETLPDAARFQLPSASQAMERSQNGLNGHKAGTDTPDTAERPSGSYHAAPGGPDAAAAPDLGNPFEMVGELHLQRLHKGGRAVYGNAWQATGPQLVFAYSDGRTDRSPELSHDEAERMIADLTAQQE